MLKITLPLLIIAGKITSSNNVGNSVYSKSEKIYFFYRNERKEIVSCSNKFENLIIEKAWQLQTGKQSAWVSQRQSHLGYDKITLVSNKLLKFTVNCVHRQKELLM